MNLRLCFEGISVVLAVLEQVVEFTIAFVIRVFEITGEVVTDKTFTLATIPCAQYLRSTVERTEYAGYDNDIPGIYPCLPFSWIRGISKLKSIFDESHIAYTPLFTCFAGVAYMIRDFNFAVGRIIYCHNI